MMVAAVKNQFNMVSTLVATPFSGSGGITLPAWRSLSRSRSHTRSLKRRMTENSAHRYCGRLVCTPRGFASCSVSLGLEWSQTSPKDPHARGKGGQAFEGAAGAAERDERRGVGTHEPLCIVCCFGWRAVQGEGLDEAEGRTLVETR
jgi:hypothetical protein